MNKSQLNHPAVTLKILHACRKAMTQSVEHVRNSKGKAFLAVRYRTQPEGEKRFEITDRKGTCMFSYIGLNKIDNAGFFLSKHVAVL